MYGLNLVISLDSWPLLFKNTKQKWLSGFDSLNKYTMLFFFIIEGITPFKNLMAQ